MNQPNLMSQLDQASLTWKGYFQGMAYAGYRGYCFPAKCNGIPDSDNQYVAKHNGIVNFANEQNATEFAKMQPYSQLSSDLAAGNVPNLSYIVPEECHDMHGAPPWCLDSGKFGGVNDDWLVATGDAFVGHTVNAITSSPVWKTGANAIVVTFDEGNFATDTVPTIVITNHGPRGVTDNASYNHYSLLATLEDAFGLVMLPDLAAESALDVPAGTAGGAAFWPSEAWVRPGCARANLLRRSSGPRPVYLGWSSTCRKRGGECRVRVPGSTVGPYVHILASNRQVAVF